MATPHKPKAKVDRRGAPKGKGTVAGKPLRPGAKPGRIGNPPFEATQEQRVTVAAMVAAGGTQPIVARHLGISEDTLGRHFRFELDTGKDFMLARIGGLVFEAAIKGDNASRFFIMKCRGGWRETERHEHNFPAGVPIVNMTVEQVLAARAQVVDEC